MSLASLLPACVGVAAVVEPTPGQSSGNLAQSVGSVEIIDNTTHNAFPGICVSDTDELMVAYRKGADHNVDSTAYFVGRWSDDGGATWSAESTIYDPDGTDPRDCTLATLADGRIAMTAFHHDGTLYESRVMFSSNNGRTFGTPIALDPAALGRVNACSGAVVECANDDLIVPLYGDASEGDLQSAAIMRSTDGGTTWGSPVVVASGPATVGDAYGAESEGSFFEPYIIRLDGTNLLCGLRHSREKFWWVKSTDNGATWGTPATSGIVGYGRPALGRIAATGAVVLSTRNNTDIYYTTNWDDGETWNTNPKVTVDTGFRMAYSQMVETSSGVLAHVWAMEDPNAGFSSVHLNYLYDASLEDPLP